MAYTYLTPYRSGGLSTGMRGGGSIFDLHRQMNRMFDDLLTGSENGSSGSITGWPSLDICQTENEIEVCAELAGVNRDDISIDVDEGMLTISGEKKSSREDDNGYSERTYGRFERRVSLPANVDEENIQADMEDGLLTITLPLTEERSRGRKIQLGSGKSQNRNNAESELIEGNSQRSEKQTSGAQSSGGQSSGKKSSEREAQSG
ncbi:Hsp20/alpha crystallin family protein [Allopontixanthobacter sp.]|uniref:Hsp20/alpha crystallin family protein n=1 Tax=Allopontixanthobacter sp. TaxID=2906452 RepID=UPI002ABCA228|nr:Hsp20/alpha crystallin family protein [Allopontixanthobacter sp.]MDZ4306284.1 Hsp20/alpha crystallin family protein [Allopontixanthobacter sp.]